MDDKTLNWGDGTQGAFNQCSIPKKCAAPPGWGRQTSAAPGFGRAQDAGMNRALVDPGLAEKQRFTHMSNTDKLGEMAGRRYVHEFDPVSGRSRGWHETVDHAGTVRQVRPELNDGAKKHYRFDSNGNYTGSW
jgi:hypothetical protein